MRRLMPFVLPLLLAPLSSRAAEPPTLLMPDPKVCLPVLTLDDADADTGMVFSQGLTAAEIAGAMDDFLGSLDRCAPPRGTVSGAMRVDFSVRCDGRVSFVAVGDDGGADPSLVACVEEVLRYVPFPAHDQPGGFEFGYRLRYRFEAPRTAASGGAYPR